MKGSVYEEDLFISHDALVLMTTKEMIKCMRENNYLHRWLIPMNGFQDGTPYYGSPVDNSPESMTVDNRLHRDILNSLHFYYILIHFLNGEGNAGEERIIRFSLSTLKEIARGLKRIWESKIGTTSSASIIEYVDLAVKALGIIFIEIGDEVEGLADRNGHRRKVVGEGKSFSLGGAKTKGEGRKCEITKFFFLQSDFLKLCLKKKHNITEFFPEITVFYD